MTYDLLFATFAFILGASIGSFLNVCIYRMPRDLSVNERDFFPVLREAGFREFTVDYLDASPVFWNMPLPEPVWELWKQADAALSQPALSFLCASGILTASAKA